MKHHRDHTSQNNLLKVKTAYLVKRLPSRHKHLQYQYKKPDMIDEHVILALGRGERVGTLGPANLAS